MLSETENILTKFRNINRKFFYESAIDFKPAEFGESGSYYGDFKEVGEVYSAMYSLYLQLDEQIFHGYYDNAYSSPIEPILSIKELNLWLADHIDRLNELNENYHGNLMPIRFTLDHFVKTQNTIKYILNLNEIKLEIGDPEKEQLIKENIELKTNNKFRSKQIKIGLTFAFYLLCLFAPIALIIIFWNKYQEGKWFQLVLFLFPIASFLYDRNAFIEVFKFSLNGKYRESCKRNIMEQIKMNSNI